MSLLESYWFQHLGVHKAKFEVQTNEQKEKNIEILILEIDYLR